MEGEETDAREGENASRQEGLGGQPSSTGDAENLAFVLASDSNSETLPRFPVAAPETLTRIRDSRNAWGRVACVPGGTQGSQESAALS
jgi:hypothetical protein